MSKADLIYQELFWTTIFNGDRRDNERTGMGTISQFGVQNRYDLREGFPILTTKYVNFNSVVKELLWFIRGETNIKTLGCGIWNAWADKNGELGPIYGEQWRNTYSFDGCEYHHIDQLAQLVDGLKSNPQSRRHIVNSWNVADLPYMALPPCHVLFQCYVSNSGELDLQLYQRSADLALGLPFNVASYALLTHLLARETGLTPRFLIHTLGDVHIYQAHENTLRAQVMEPWRIAPRLNVNQVDSLFGEIAPDQIVLENYNHGPKYTYEVAV